jgi:hypothetical protein
VALALLCGKWRLNAGCCPPQPHIQHPRTNARSQKRNPAAGGFCASPLEETGELRHAHPRRWALPLTYPARPPPPPPTAPTPPPPPPPTLHPPTRTSA